MWGYIIGILGVVIGVVVAVVLYLRGKREREPCWAFETHSVIGMGAELGEAIQILFEGRAVPQVSVTRLLLWNQGRGAIRKADVVDEVTAEFPENAMILREPRVLKRSREAIGFSAKRQDHSIPLTFEFLDRGDGASIEIVHTGGVGTKPQLSGTIIGVPKEVKPMGTIPSSRPAIWFLLLYGGSGVAALLAGVISWILLGEFSFWVGFLVAAGVGALTGATPGGMDIFRVARKKFPLWIYSEAE